MKNLCTVMLFSLLLFCGGFAQITITSSDISSFYAAGQTIMNLSNDDPNTTMDIGSATSSSQNWTLPNVSYPDTFYSQSIDVATSPYAAEFPTATHCIYGTFSDDTSTVTLYTYAQVSSSEIATIGEVQHYQTTSFDTTMINHEYSLKYKLPLTFNSSFEISKDTMDFGVGFFTVSSSAISVDAFGKINLPPGNVDALRLREIRKSESYFNNMLISSSSEVYFSWLTKSNGSADISVDDSSASGNVQITSISLSILPGTTDAIEEKNTSPQNFTLSQNYPNPFNPNTIINYSLEKSSQVSLKVYDALGNEVAALVDEFKPAGYYEVNFNASRLSSGIYFYKLTAGNFSEVKKMTLLR